MAPHEQYGQTPPGTVPRAAGQEAAAQRPGLSTGTIIVIAVVTAIIVSMLGGLAAGFVGARLGAVGFNGTTLTPARITVIPSRTDEPVVAAAAAALPSVVNIDITTGGKSSGSGGGLPNNHPNVPSQGNGSGVVYKGAPGGGTYIITNNHVVEGAQSIRVNEPGSKTWDAQLVGRDPETDIAVVKISGSLPPIQIGDSDKLIVGQTAVAIGSPFGLSHTVTSGVISALGRSIPDFSTANPGTTPLVDVIQTDAAINPGNSGGALVNRMGQLIGINTAIFSESGSSGGIGFAIPSKTAVRVADQLISGGTVQHPFIGIVGQTVTPALAAAKKLPVQEGALVVDFTAGSTAQKAGIQKGDIIVSLNGNPVNSMDDLVLQVRRQTVGSTVQLGIVRNGNKQTIPVQIGEKPANLSTPSQSTTIP